MWVLLPLVLDLVCPFECSSVVRVLLASFRSPCVRRPSPGPLSVLLFYILRYERTGEELLVFRLAVASTAHRQFAIRVELEALL